VLVGAGGREDAIRWKLEQSPEAPVVICAPGNAGCRMAYRAKIDVNDKDEFVGLLEREGPDLVVFGPEAPLIAGYADLVSAQDILAFGPSKTAAWIEGDKSEMKDFCTRNDLPTAPYVNVRDNKRHDAFAAIDRFVNDYGELPVIKASGPCGGKGVILPDTVNGAYKTADDMLSGSSFGDAGKVVVIEKRLLGVEYSGTALTDGTDAVFLPIARDHKRRFDGDKGPNTGGMGAIAPIPDVDPELVLALQDIVRKAILALKAEGCEYRGALYAGFMVDKTEAGYDINLLEFNCRLGDPETQVMLPLIESDLLPYFRACAAGKGLKELGPLKVSEDFAVGVVLVAEGYPETSSKDERISDSGQDLPDTLLFHAGTEVGTMGSVVTNGGRIAAAIGLGKTVQEATDNAYLRAKALDFPGVSMRSDIPRL
jgi:phosphoribosylamine--glycine ligase